MEAITNQIAWWWGGGGAQKQVLSKFFFLFAYSQGLENGYFCMKNNFIGLSD